MESTKPIMITRQKTVIIEAAEKQSRQYEPGLYETIMNKGIEINNGDVISLESAFIDTSKIDPNTIFIEDDVVITWNNGIYLINQQLETVIPSSSVGLFKVITDNNPIVLCQNHVEQDISGLKLFTTASCQFAIGAAVSDHVGDVDMAFQITDVNGVVRDKILHIPRFDTPGGDPGTFNRDWTLNVISRTIPIARDPNTGKLTQPNDFKIPDNTAKNGYAFQPIRRDPSWSDWPYGSLKYEEVDSGFFTAVINDGTFTISAGTYEPAHLAKLLTDGFDRLNTARDFQNPVPKNHLFPFQATFQNAVPPGNLDTTLITVDFNQLPFDWSIDALLGWKAQMTYRTGTGAVSPIIGTFSLVVNSIYDPLSPSNSDPINTFRVNYQADFPATSIYPPGGGPCIILTPPDGYNDKGSAFLQSTENYNLLGVDGKPIFAFVDTLNHRNIFTFPHDGPYSWIGSNNVEITWDADQKRFRFNYLHFPLTSGEGQAPAIINQVSYNYYFDDGAEPPIPESYVRNYSPAKSVNITTKAYGGVFFFALEPFKSFWEDIMGFDSSILAQEKYDPKAASLDFNDGISTALGAPVIYEEVKLPTLIVTPGVNTTEQLFVLGDLTGKPANYTGAGYIPYSTTATPNDGAPGQGDGRVAVSPDDVVPIIADRSNQLGQQTSGYYIVDIDAGATYNESIGSDSIQESYSRNIRGVIDRYYSANSYTSSQGGDISYIHYGNSFMLKSLKVRITNSDGSKIRDLGTDNTVFIKVIKNNQINISPDPVIPPAK